MIDTALLVIDAQASFRHRPYYTDQDVPGFVAQVQAQVDRAQGMAVVQVSTSRTKDRSRKRPGW